MLWRRVQDPLSHDKRWACKINTFFFFLINRLSIINQPSAFSIERSLHLVFLIACTEGCAYRALILLYYCDLKQGCIQDNLSTPEKFDWLVIHQPKNGHNNFKKNEKQTWISKYIFKYTGFKHIVSTVRCFITEKYEYCEFWTIPLRL